MTHEKRIMSVLIGRKGEPIFAEGATTISIKENVETEFVTISQADDEYDGTLAFDKDEWKVVKQAVDEMFETCREY